MCLGVKAIFNQRGRELISTAEVLGIVRRRRAVKQEPTWEETIDNALRALSKAANGEVDRNAVAEKIESVISEAQLERLWKGIPAPPRKSRKLFETALKQMRELQETLKSIQGKEHRDVLISAQLAAYSELPTIHEEVDAENERLPQEVRQESPVIHGDIAAIDFLRIEKELMRFDERWNRVVNALGDRKGPIGRPTTEWKTQLMCDLAIVYKELVGKEPPRSNQGPFVNLCNEVIRFLEHGKHRYAGGDTVKKALIQSTEVAGN